MALIQLISLKKMQSLEIETNLSFSLKLTKKSSSEEMLLTSILLSVLAKKEPSRLLSLFPYYKSVFDIFSKEINQNIISTEFKHFPSEIDSLSENILFSNSCNAWQEKDLSLIHI